jgi:hypothetical protein
MRLPQARLLALTCLLGCVAAPLRADNPAQIVPAERNSSTPAQFPRKLDLKFLPNPVQLHPKVISGGLPEGDAAFQELADLGVKTVINVDGVKPDLERARKFGLRYVHLPHGYDGIPQQRGLEMAKAVRDLDGIIYFHCHHGKHRSPAAASVACVSAGFITPEAALTVLKMAETSPNYRGLFESVKRARPLSKQTLDEINVEYRPTVPIPAMAQAMVSLDHTHDHIQQIAEADWRVPRSHPDLDPAHEALLLREHFTELLRTDEVQQRPREFRQLLENSETAARELEQALRNWQAVRKPSDRPPAVLTELNDRISTNCNTCHRAYRNTPLGEK